MQVGTVVQDKLTRDTGTITRVSKTQPDRVYVEFNTIPSAWVRKDQLIIK